MKQLYILLLFITLLGCTKDFTTNYKKSTLIDIAKAEHQFSWNIFQKEIELHPTENILISPLSIHMALAMSQNGALENTRDEILKSMHCNDFVQSDINESYFELSKLLRDSINNPVVNISNAFFYDAKRLTLIPFFKETLQQKYEGAFVEENFNNSSIAKNNINKWVKEKTGGKIDGIIEDISLDDIAFLINTLYFRADWSIGFDPKRSYCGFFNQADSNKVEVQYMSQEGFFIQYGMTNEFEMVDKPFKDSTFSLSIVLPKNGTNSPLTETKYEALLNTVSTDYRTLVIPKMKLDYKSNLIPNLSALGINDAFNNSANFTLMGIADKKIYLSKVDHKSVLVIDEKGAEGSGATALGFSIAEAPPSFFANRPYYIILRHIETNAIMFIGWIGYKMH